MRRSVSERVQPSKQHQPKEEYPPPEKEALNAKIFDCIHNAQSGHINEFSGTARRKRARWSGERCRNNDKAQRPCRRRMSAEADAVVKPAIHKLKRIARVR